MLRLGARGTAGRGPSRTRPPPPGKGCGAARACRVELAGRPWASRRPVLSVCECPGCLVPWAVDQGGEGSLPEPAQPPEGTLRPRALWVQQGLSGPAWGGHPICLGNHGRGWPNKPGNWSQTKKLSSD